MRRTPIRPRRMTPRRTPQRDHGLPMGDARALVYARARGLCEGCGTPMTVDTMEAHHRLKRRYGPDCPCNLVGLCGRCHHERCHQRPIAARLLGWIILANTLPLRDPRDVPCTRRQVAVYFRCDGSLQSAPWPSTVASEAEPERGAP